MAIEDMLDGIKTYFDSNLTSALAAIETARSVTIPRWKAMDTAEIRSRQLPSIEILPDSQVAEHGDDESPLESDYWLYYAITVWVTYAGSDAKAVQYALMRYQEAIEDLIIADSTLGNLANRVRATGADFSPAVEAQKDGSILQVLTQDLEIRDLAN